MNTPLSSFQTASSSLPVGTHLGEFEITGVIGEGGFGIVYSAHDSSLERIVAIKEYLPSAFAQRGGDGTVQVKSEDHRKTFAAGLASFINEARMLAKFAHPGLVEVFRFWEANGTAYMAMRYYRGVTLREMLRTSPQLVTEQWLCETLDPILLALKELHNERCFHRDIAPDNILVLPNGRSVLMDFGAARRIISGMTQALTTVLKPGYAPIEQYYDDGSMQQGAWTDIYAVGGLLYHVMTGKVPVQAISRMISDPLKPVSEVATGVFSPRLCSVVMKCLAVLPENRYQNVEELRAALGWVTTPLVSTVIHKPITEVDQEFPSTVIVNPVNRVDLASHNTANSMGVPQSPAPATDPDATAIAARTQNPESVSSFSIDELISAPLQAPAPQASSPSPAVSVTPAETKPQVKTPDVKYSAPLWIKAAVASVVVVVLIGVGYFLSGLRSTGEPATQAIIQEEAAPTVVAPVHATGPAEPASVTVQVVSPAPSASAALPEPVATQNPVPVPVPATAAAVAASGGLMGSDAPGSVRVELKGGWGNVFIDGEQKGTVPPVLIVKLPPGNHDVEIRNPAMPVEKRTIAVSSGKTVIVRHAF